MQNIFRAPVDHKHFKDTIEVGKTITEISKFLHGNEKLKLQQIVKDSVVRYWGSLPGQANLRYIDRLHEGDELLCYRSGKYIALAKIAFKTVNSELAKYSWGQTERGTTWELMYFFSEVSFFEIDSAVINGEFGFKAGPVMGFIPLNEERAKEFLNKHGSLKNFISKLATQDDLKKTISEEISKLQIKDPFEAQFYLVDLGNQLEFETYVPNTDSGHEAFGKKLGELITITREDIVQYVAPAIFDPLSHIDVIWFKENYRPQYFYEVIHSSGMNEAFARLKAVSDHYEHAKTRIIGNKEKEFEFQRSRRLYFPNSNQISYKIYNDLIDAHSETTNYKKIINAFLND